MFLEQARELFPDSHVWTKKLFDQAIETRLNIIFESTMRESGPIAKTMKRLKSQGYHIAAQVVVTHERMSKTSIFRRHQEQKAAKGYGRWGELSSHDAGYEGVLKTVERIEKYGLVDKLEVYNRVGDLLYVNEYCAGEWFTKPNAVAVIEAERQRKPTERERANFPTDWQRIYALMEDRKASVLELELARSTCEKGSGLPSPIFMWFDRTGRPR